VALAIVLITVWYREGDAGPLHKAKTGVQVVVAPVQAGGELLTRPVRGLFEWASDLGVSRSQLQALREQNQSLRVRVAELEEARLENERLQALLDLPQAKELKSVAAHVIGRPTNSWDGVIVIDRGSNDGVKPGMPVVGPQGLLGQTVLVAPGSSKVRLITDQRSGVAALIQRTRAEGVVRGTIDGRLTLDFVAKAAPVKVGDVVLTSGMGGVYPKGLPIGEVSEVRREANDLYQFIRVEPASDPAGLEEVLVVVGEPAAVVPQGGE
jgi:rod shape-determining protein MreC